MRWYYVLVYWENFQGSLLEGIFFRDAKNSYLSYPKGIMTPGIKLSIRVSGLGRSLFIIDSSRFISIKYSFPLEIDSTKAYFPFVHSRFNLSRSWSHVLWAFNHEILSFVHIRSFLVTDGYSKHLSLIILNKASSSSLSLWGRLISKGVWYPIVDKVMINILPRRWATEVSKGFRSPDLRLPPSSK